MHSLMPVQFRAPAIGGEGHQGRHLNHELAARGHDVAVTTLWKEGLADLETDEYVGEESTTDGCYYEGGWGYDIAAPNHA